jgi:hypothetical protein
MESGAAVARASGSRATPPDASERLGPERSAGKLKAFSPATAGVVSATTHEPAARKGTKSEGLGSVSRESC